MVSWYLGSIHDTFEAEGFAADLDYSPPVKGDRRQRVEQFYRRIDWQSWDEVRRMLRVIEAVLDWLVAEQVRDPAYADNIEESRAHLITLLRRDGFELDNLGTIHARWEILAQQAIQDLPTESAIPGHLRRMWDTVESRPEQSISAAKDAIESTAKHALGRLDIPLTGREKLPALVACLQRELKLHPKAVSPDRDGIESIVRVLGGLSGIAVGVDELRNLYGDGHGRESKVSGLGPRHSRLVARSTDAYVGMILETLRDPGAPWQASENQQAVDDQHS